MKSPAPLEFFGSTSIPHTGSLVPLSVLFPVHPGCGHLHPAFRIDEEVARDDDLLACHESLCYLHPVSEAPARFHLPGFEEAIAAVHEDGLFEARVEDRIRRDGECGRERDRELHVHEHVRSEHIAGVVQFQAHLQCAGGGIELGQHLAHHGVELFLLLGQGDLHLHARV